MAGELNDLQRRASTYLPSSGEKDVESGPRVSLKTKRALLTEYTHKCCCIPDGISSNSHHGVSFPIVSNASSRGYGNAAGVGSASVAAKSISALFSVPTTGQCGVIG